MYFRIMNKCLKSRLLTALAFVLPMLPLSAQPEAAPAAASDLPALRKTCEQLAEQPRDEAALAALLAYAKNTNNVDRLRSRAMAGYALSSLFTGNTNLYTSARNSHARAYPDDTHLLRIDLKTCYVSCKECQGRGSIASICPACEGNDKCKACNGTGERLQRKNLKGSRDTGIKCSVCGGTGQLVCQRCRGTGQLVSTCPTCKGMPEKFVTPTKVHDDFTLIMKGITKWINNEEVFSQSFQAAKAKASGTERVTALKELLANYSYREEKGEIEKLLAAELDVIQGQTKDMRELREREQREIALLRGLKGSPNVAASITTMNEYLEEHPDSEYRLELQSIVNHMRAELQRQNIKRRNLYVVGGIILLLFAASCIHINHYNYNIFSHQREREKESE